MKHPHLFVDISSHGFGHLAQTAPVLNALAERWPELRLTVRCGLPPAILRSRIRGAFTHVAGASDFGFAMRDAMRIDFAATAAAYRAQHADWAARVEQEATFLRHLAPDRVLTDVAYLPLAGAARAGIPSLAMCSLNWAGLFSHYYGREVWAGAISAEILAAYRGAECFLRLTPAMPMDELSRTLAIGPVAALGVDRRAEVREKLADAGGKKIVLIAFGGIDKNLDVKRWPADADLHWLVPCTWEIARADVSAFEALEMNFTDVLRSVDAVLTKPGYGTFTEAACNGTPVLYARRHDWPEQDCLIDWLRANARQREVSAAELATGELTSALDAVWRQTAPRVPVPSGAREAAELIAARWLR